MSIEDRDSVLVGLRPRHRKNKRQLVGGNGAWERDELLPAHEGNQATFCVTANETQRKVVLHSCGCVPECGGKLVRRQRFGGCGRISVTLRRAYCGQVEVLRPSDGARVPRVLVVKHLRIRFLCQRVGPRQARAGHWHTLERHIRQRTWVRKRVLRIPCRTAGHWRRRLLRCQREPASAHREEPVSGATKWSCWHAGEASPTKVGNVVPMSTELPTFVSLRTDGQGFGTGCA